MAAALLPTWADAPSIAAGDQRTCDRLAPQASRRGQGGKGLAIAGLVLGYVWLGLTALIIIVALTGNSTPGTSPSSSTVYAVGQTVTTTTNATYTVTAVSRVQDTSTLAPQTPSATGGYFYGVDVKICAGNGQELADPYGWAVIMSDDTQYESGAILLQPSRGPALQAEEVQPGACTAGWVYFDLPPSPTPARVERENTTWSWSLSG
jgi:hypothetical protein